MEEVITLLRKVVMKMKRSIFFMGWRKVGITT